MSKLMDVSDQDVAVIEEVIAERLALGASQVVAQRQAVAEAIAQLADERGYVMGQIEEQLGVAPVKENRPKLSVESIPMFANKPFYSALGKALAEIPTKVAPGRGWSDAVKGLVNKGVVKADEVEWSGLNDWLELQTGKVTRDQVVQYLDANGVKVKETTLTNPEDMIDTLNDKLSTSYDYGAYYEYGDVYYIDPDGDVVSYKDLPTQVKRIVDQFGQVNGQGAKYDQYALPGGNNYREVLLALPFQDYSARLKEIGAAIPKASKKAYAKLRDEEDSLITLRNEQEKSTYTSQHWDQKNVIAHIRVDDRVDADGSKVLFVEEIQSDWGQDGKKKGFNTPRKGTVEKNGDKYDIHWADGSVASGYSTEVGAQSDIAKWSEVGKVPAAPFVTNTQGWLNLALKRVITMAVEGGYDKVAFVNGEQSADRYDLSKQIDHIEYRVSGDNNYIVHVYAKNGDLVRTPPNLDADGLEDHVGKELTKKIVDTATTSLQHLENLDLKVGGEGMKTFYDSIVPNAANALLKKLGGGKLQTVSISIGDRAAIENWKRMQAGSTIKSTTPLKEHNDQPGFTITPALREKAAGGLPMFSNRAQIEADAYAMIEADPEGMVNDYLRKHDKIIDPDLVKGVFPAYKADRSLAAAVHEPSSKLSKMIYTEALARNKGAPVVFTAGGGGSGKSEAMIYAKAAANVGDNPLTYDSTLSSYASAKQRIDQALSSGAPVRVVYTNTPVKKAFGFAITRDRVVPISVLAAAHVGASNTIRRLAEHYKNHPSVRIFIINNRGEINDISLGKIDDVPTYDHNDIERSLYEIASQLHADGSITDKAYTAATSEPIGVRSADAESPGPLQGRDSGQDLEGSGGRIGSQTGSLDTPFANKPTTWAATPWTDATHRVQFKPGAWLNDHIGATASPLLNLAGMKMMRPELKRQVRKMRLSVEQAQELSSKIAKEMFKLLPDEREMVSHLIEKTLKPGVIPPAHAVKLAAMITATMETQSRELVRLGMLTQEAADRWKGVYLPRFYLKKMGNPTSSDAWADALAGIHRKVGLMRGVKGKSLRSRGMFETIDPGQIQDYTNLGWEVRDPDYQPGASQAQVWRDFTPAEREQMGEIKDAGFRFVMGYMQTQRDIALGRMFEAMANDADMSSRLPTKELTVQVPSTKVTGTGANVYGQMAGRWVSEETLSHLSSFEEAHSDLLTAYRQALAIWKEGKTVLNPVSHLNNMVSNVTMAHLAGIGYHRGDLYLGAAHDFMTKDHPMIAEAKAAGLFLGSFNQAELANSMPDDLKAMARMQDSLGLKVTRTAMNVLTLGLRQAMGRAYQFEDSFFKYLIYKDARKRGLSQDDAVDYAQKYIFTYDDLPKGARRIRDFGIPFFAYTYKAAPILLETALTRPHRMIVPAALLYAAGSMAYAFAAAVGDEPWDELVKKFITDDDFRAKANALREEDQAALPVWMRGHTAFFTPKALRVGFDKTLDLPVFLDISRLIPGGDLFDVTPNAGGIPTPQPLTPSHPLIGITMAMLGNKDLFTGKDLVDKSDTRGEATEKRLTWLYKQVAPAMAIGSYHFDRAMNTVAQANGGEITWLPEVISERYTGMGKDGLPVTPEYSIPQTFGIKVRPIDLEKSRQIEAAMDRKLVTEIDAEIRQLNRLNSQGVLSDKLYDKQVELQRTKRDRLKDGLTVDGDTKD